jgi:hypothetical protein
MKRSERNECRIGHDVNFDKKKFCSKIKNFLGYTIATIFLTSKLVRSKNLRLLGFGCNLAQVPETETCQTNLNYVYNSFITFFHILLVPFFIIVYIVVGLVCFCLIL